jgi:hypothetical protein
MKDPQRLLEGDATSLERALLDSAASDGATASAVQRAMGVFKGASGGLAGAAALSATSLNAASAQSLSVAIAKWIGIGTLAGLVAGGATLAVQEAMVERPLAGGVQTSPLEPGARSTATIAPAAASPPATPATDTALPAEQAPNAGNEPSPGVRAAARRPEPPADGVAPARIASAPAASNDTSEQPEAAPVEIAPAAPVPAAPAPAAAPTPGPSARAESLLAQVRLLDEARRQLARRDAGASLATLDRHAREFPRSAFSLEANLLRIEAFMQRGDRQRAWSIARPILESDPRGPHAARVRSLMGLRDDRAPVE